MRRPVLALLAGMAFALTAVSAPAAPPTSPDPRLDARLDAASAQAVEEFLAEARVDSLPTEPLVQRALEGATKGASGPRIVAAVEALLQRLRVSRELIGTSSSGPELVAAAGALQAGVDTATIAGIRESAEDQDLTVRLVVLTDLIGRGVPGKEASSVILDWSRLGTTDGVFLGLRQGVEMAILSGTSPEAAMAAGVRASRSPPPIVGPRLSRPGEGGGP